MPLGKSAFLMIYVSKARTKSHGKKKLNQCHPTASAFFHDEFGPYFSCIADDQRWAGFGQQPCARRRFMCWDVFLNACTVYSPYQFVLFRGLMSLLSIHMTLRQSFFLVLILQLLPGKLDFYSLLYLSSVKDICSLYTALKTCKYSVGKRRAFLVCVSVRVVL